MAAASANFELDRRFTDEVRALCRARLQAAEAAETLLARREQLVAIREAAIGCAIACCNGSARNLEAAVNAAVTTAAAKVPPPVFVAGFVAELEDHAVTIETGLRAVRQQLAELRRREDAVTTRERDAKVVAERARLLDESSRAMLAHLRARELELGGLGQDQPRHTSLLSHDQLHRPGGQQDSRSLSTGVLFAPDEGFGSSLPSPQSPPVFRTPLPRDTRAVDVADCASQTDAAAAPLQSLSGSTVSNSDEMEKAIRRREQALASQETRLGVALRQHELEAGCLRQQQQWLAMRLEALEEIEERLRSFGFLDTAAS
jgi:hypothetical protein